MQLIVLGMHRSGTSVLARMLNLMGAYFGPEGMSTGANRENPKGFWERRDVRKLNDALLHSVGCDWNRIHGFDPERIPDHVVAAFEERASRLVLEMDAHRPWLMKEPRLCLLLPLWRRVLEIPFYVHVLRNPVEVASSLYKRNAIPIPVGLALWEKYVRSALANSGNAPGVMLSHGSLISDPEESIARLYRQLDQAGVVGLRMPSALELQAFVDPRLHRERSQSDELLQYADEPQVALFKSLLEAPLPAASSAAISHELQSRLKAYEDGLPPLPPTNALVLPMSPRERAQEQAREQVRKEAAEALAGVRKLKTMIAPHLHGADEPRLPANAQQQRESRAHSREMAKLTRLAIEREEAHARAARQSAEKADALKKELSSSKEALGFARAELDTVKARLDAITREKETLDARLAVASANLKRASDERDGARRQVEQAAEKQGQLARQLAEATGSAQQCSMDLEQARRIATANQHQRARETALLRQQVHTLQSRLEAQMQLTRAMAQSLSWRLTSPLRWLGSRRSHGQAGMYQAIDAGHQSGPQTRSAGDEGSDPGEER